MCQWRRQDFVTGGSEVWVYRGSRVRSPTVPVVLSVYQRGSLLEALQCISRVIRRSSMTMKAHTYYIIFGRPPIGRKLPPPPGGATEMFYEKGMFSVVGGTSAATVKPWSLAEGRSMQPQERRSRSEGGRAICCRGQ